MLEKEYQNEKSRNTNPLFMFGRWNILEVSMQFNWTPTSAPNPVSVHVNCHGSPLDDPLFF